MENSNKLSRDIKIKTYLRKTELLGNSLLENGKSFSISIEVCELLTKTILILYLYLGSNRKNKKL